MQQNVTQPAKPQTPVPAQPPVQLTPAQLRQVSGAGPQQSSIPAGGW